MQHDLALVGQGSGPMTDSAALSVRRLAGFAEAEPAWRVLQARGLASPGQDFDTCRRWCEALAIPADRIAIVLAEGHGAPLALLPLLRQPLPGLKAFGWMLGRHVGANAPLVDPAALAALDPATRSFLWAAMAKAARADLLFLRDVPAEQGASLGLGHVEPSDTLYRARFPSFAEADATQRNKSRRKHDRQQGDKLAAMGAVTFAEIGNGDPAMPEALGTMFLQRAERFAEMGVADPFADPMIRSAYGRLADPTSGVVIRMHLLRLDGEIVATRYSIVLADSYFCLISSMSTEPRLQPGSPGKQCLLNVMQTLFDTGGAVFDMGSGLTDEKRHWCNEAVPLSHHYLPVTPAGAAAAAGHRRLQALRRRVKDDERLKRLAHTGRAAIARLTRRS
jgi:CelD/BcsL family acetyltransferase involved in cellulose biosynthesis